MNIGKFKKGDRLVFNWSAKATIPTIVIAQPGAHVVEMVTWFSDCTEYVEWKDPLFGCLMGADSFWLRRVWPWEK